LRESDKVTDKAAVKATLPIEGAKDKRLFSLEIVAVDRQISSFSDRKSAFFSAEQATS
jgi:hypothetical protein